MRMIILFIVVKAYELKKLKYYLWFYFSTK